MKFVSPRPRSMDLIVWLSSCHGRPTDVRSVRDWVDPLPSQCRARQVGVDPRVGRGADTPVGSGRVFRTHDLEHARTP
jgi:hypothetical protein